VNINEFYAGDARRRASEEVEYGREWRDEHHLCSLWWVVDTGELYLVFQSHGVASALLGFLDASGGSPAWSDTGSERLDVEIVAVIEERAEVEALLEGWEDVVGRDDSFAWLRGRLAPNPMG
jgi:hypothetical protein